jgi:hypothetical protein
MQVAKGAAKTAARSPAPATGEAEKKKLVVEVRLRVRVGRATTVTLTQLPAHIAQLSPMNPAVSDSSPIANANFREETPMLLPAGEPDRMKPRTCTPVIFAARPMPGCDRLLHGSGGGAGVDQWGDGSG